MPEKLTYQELFDKLVNECKWPKEAANQFILNSVQDETIKAEAKAALAELTEPKVIDDKPEKQAEANPVSSKVNITVDNVPKKSKKKYKLVRKIAAVVMTISLAGLAYMAPGIIDKINDYQANDQLNQEVASLVVTEDAYANPEVGTEINESTVQTFKDIDFTSLKQINPDTVGWLEWEGTNVDYPVVQTSDNNYYLHHAIDGSANAAGTIFMDKDNSANFSDDVTVIYGHNMMDDSMFGSLSNLQDQNFYNAHPTMYYHTEDSVYEIDLFAGVDQDFTTLTYGNYSDHETMVNDMNAVKQISTFQSDVQINEDSQVVVLSTCLDSGSNGTEHRFLVYGSVQKVLDKTIDNNISMGRQI